MRAKKTIRTLCVILLMLLVCAGTLILLRPQIDSLRREQVSEELMEKIKSGETDIRIENVPIIEGAEAEFAAETPAPKAERRPAIEVTGYGVIEIPAIELAMPLVRGCGEQALMAAAGWYEESAEPGTAGNCVILGHRMSGYGEHFNRLDELKKGDEIVVTLADGTYYTRTEYGVYTMQAAGVHRISCIHIPLMKTMPDCQSGQVAKRHHNSIRCTVRLSV